jgi:phosphate/sulfate permease
VVTYILAIVVIAFVFDFINGFHDSANSIATIVGTRVLSPVAAVIWAAVFNFGAILGGTAVAKTVATGFVDPAIVDPNLMCAALLGAIVWNLITWFYGIPSSSSHALIGGLAGAALAKAGAEGITFGRKWVETLGAIVVSPLLGATMGFLLMVFVFNVFRRASPRRVDRVFRPGQLLSSACCRSPTGATTRRRRWGSWSGCSPRRRRRPSSATRRGRCASSTCATRRASRCGGGDGVPRHLARHPVRRVADRAHHGLAHHAACARWAASARRPAAGRSSSSPRTSASR